MRIDSSRREVLLALPALAATAGYARADADPNADALARISAARASVRTLRGPFTQTRTIGLLATDVRSTGTMSLERPDRLLWELAPPDDVTFWVGPEGLSYRSAHGRGSIPAASAKIGAALLDLQTLLGGDLHDLRRRWELRVLRDDAEGVELETVPKVAAQGGPRTMRFALGPDRVRPTRALLVLGPRDQTQIVFGPLTVNEPFAITPPPKDL